MEPHQPQTPRHSVSVAGVITDANGSHVLLIQRRDNGHWEPPGGVLELGETIEDGLRREIAEETGAQVEILALTGVYKNMTRGIVALVYRCRLTNEPATATDEALVVAWQDVDDIDRLMAPAYAIRVHDAVSGQPAATRAHDGIDLSASSQRASDTPSRCDASPLRRTSTPKTARNAAEADVPRLNRVSH